VRSGDNAAQSLRRPQTRLPGEVVAFVCLPCSRRRSGVHPEELPRLGRVVSGLTRSASASLPGSCISRQFTSVSGHPKRANSWARMRSGFGSAHSRCSSPEWLTFDTFRQRTEGRAARLNS